MSFLTIGLVLVFAFLSKRGVTLKNRKTEKLSKLSFLESLGKLSSTKAYSGCIQKSRLTWEKVFF